MKEQFTPLIGGSPKGRLMGASMQKDNITIYDIAKEVGVSPASVSRVINGTGYVSAEKTLQVQKVIEKYKFQPNAIARGLTNKQSKTIGMLLPDVRNPFYATIFVAIEEEAIKNGYNVILCNTVSKKENDYSYINMLMQKQVDALVQIGGQTDEKEPSPEYLKMVKDVSERIPFITSGKLNGRKTYMMQIDDEAAMEKMLNKLYQSGHHNFVIVGGDTSVIPTAKKFDLFTRVLTNLAIPEKHRRIFEYNNYDMGSGYEFGKKLIKDKDMPTAIIGINELTAIGILKALIEAKFHIPEDVSIVGFDNTYLSETTFPAISSIGCNYKEYAEKLLKMIMQVTNGEKVRRKNYVSSVYIERETCGINSNIELC